MILMGPFRLKIFYDLCMDFSWEHKCVFHLCFRSVLCLFSISLSVSGSRYTLPALPCLVQGLVLVVHTETAIESTFLFPAYCILLCQSFHFIPGMKGQSCLFLLLLSPCPGPHCCQSLAALPKSGSSSFEDQPAHSAAVPASFHWGFSLSLSGPFASINAC